MAGTSCAAVSYALEPAHALLHRYNANGGTVFNGGKSQVNFDYIGFAAEYPFLNYAKTAAAWGYASGVNSGGQVSPQYNDANGYPMQCPSSTSGYLSNVVIPPTTVRGGTYTISWTGGDSGTVMKWFGTIVSGSQNGANGTMVVQPNASPVPVGVTFGVTTISSSPPTNYVTGISIVYTADLAAYNAGEIFGTQFKAMLSQGGFGVYRFLNWAEGIPVINMTTWATRKPVGYFTYGDTEFRASLFAGTTSEGSFNGYDYALASPLAQYAWPGWTSGAPNDKQTIQLYFDQNATYTSSSGVTFTGTSTVNWGSAHGFTAGTPINFVTNGTGFPNNISNSVTYYVLSTGLTSTTFEVSAGTAGGSPVTFTPVGGSPTYIGIRLPTLNLSSGGPIAIKLYAGNGLPQANFPTVNSGGGQAALATLVYDADLNSWLKAGGDSNTGSCGLGNGCPYEIMLQLCKEMGAHPWFTAPFMAVDPMTDFHTQLATYIKTNMPSWMIPRFETCNELWNNGNNATTYAFGKSFVHWNTQFGVGQFDQNDWQGKTASTIGQAVYAAYGTGVVGGITGAQYQIVNGQWTSAFPNAGANGQTARLESTSYVAQSQSAQAGYTKTAAYLWNTHVNCNNYFNPTAENSGTETTDAATLATEAAQIIGSIASGVLTVTQVGVQDWSGVGYVAAAQVLTDQYGIIPSGVTITGQTGGTTGGVGTYSISNSSIACMSGTIINCISSAAAALATSYADTCGGAADGINNLAQLKLYCQHAFGWAATYTNSAGNTLGGCFYEGGYSPDYDGAANNVRFLRYLSKLSSDVGLMITGGTLANSDVIAGNYPDMIAAGGLFPSLYQMGGTQNVWSVLDPDVYASPTSAQWNAIATYH